MLERPTLLPDWQKARLLRLARETAQLALCGAEASGLDVPSVEGRFGGVFVTFWNKRRLRGCVGGVAGTDEICEQVQHVTRSSLADPRFRDDPIRIEELTALTIEISLISDPVRVTNPSGLICGVHGIIVRRADRSGCFLPRVAAEKGWSAEEFLSNCCTLKAGLPVDAWRQPETEVLLFTADSFEDSISAGDWVVGTRNP